MANHMDNSMDLERELLAAYIESDSHVNSKTRKILGSERPFYELGEYCAAAYLKNPLAIFSPEMKEIRKKVLGEQFRAVGEAWAEKNEGALVDMLTKGKDSIKEIPAELIADISNSYLNSMSEFSQGFYDKIGKKAYENMTDMFSDSVEMFNGIWRMCGFKIPEKNGYADKFANLVKNHDLAGMIKIYHEHPDKISEAYPDAKKFMVFVESKIKK
jgi:hypothetical protein